MNGNLAVRRQTIGYLSKHDNCLLMMTVAFFVYTVIELSYLVTGYMQVEDMRLPEKVFGGLSLRNVVS